MSRSHLALRLTLTLFVGAPVTAQQSGWRANFDALDAPFLLDEQLLIASGSDGSIVAFDVATGERRWGFQVGTPDQASNVIVTNETSLAGQIAAARAILGRRIRLGPPVRHGATVYVVSAHEEPPDLPNVYALHAVTGEERWNFFADGGAQHVSVPIDDRVIVASDRWLYALDTSTGRLAWQFEPLPGLDELAHRAPGRPQFQNGVLYFTVWPTHQEDTPHTSFLHAVAADAGTSVWSFEVPGWDVTAPVLDDRRAYFAVRVGGDLVTVDGASRVNTDDVHVGLHAVNLDAGTVAWRARVDGARAVGRIMLGAGGVYLASDSGVAAFDAETGERRWTVTPRRRVILPYVRADNGRLIVPTEGELQIIDTPSGEVLYSVRHRAEGEVNLVTSTDAYVSTHDRLARYDLESGRRLWEQRLDTSIGDLALGPDGWLYVSAERSLVMGRKPDPGHVYKLDPDTGRWR